MISPTFPAIVRAVQNDHLTYLSAGALNDLHLLISEIERRGTPGIVIEAGCALGGSAIVLASAKAQWRPFFIYDVFGMIPPPSDRDDTDVHERYKVIHSGASSGIGGNPYYGYDPNLYETVIQNFLRHGLDPNDLNIKMIKGLFEDTIELENFEVAVAHIDGDWYHSVMTCLMRIAPRLVQGGVLVIDDYDSWSGCRRAVDEYFSTRSAEFTFVKRERLHIVRK